jgi:hypothetical protein
VYFPKIPRAHSGCWALEWPFYSLLRSFKGEKEKSLSHSVYFPKIPRAHSCCWALEWLFYALLRSFKGV